MGSFRNDCTLNYNFAELGPHHTLTALSALIEGTEPALTCSFESSTATVSLSYSVTRCAVDS